MQSTTLVSMTGLALLFSTLNSPAGPEEPSLSDAPPAPGNVSHLPRRSPIQPVEGGFAVNIGSREEVRSFFNAVYRSSDGVPMNSTANISACTPGTNATAFNQAVLRRINWFRAMAGVSASTTLSAVNSAKDQQAAVIMSRNNMLSHFPPVTWTCYTAGGDEAAQNSNLALGSSGPEAITGYVWDYGANNAAVGHRRWILYPQTQIMGTGDVPEQGSYSAANATWVFDGHYFDPRPGTREPYVAWPPPGYVPYPVVFPRWSFAYANAFFTNATVSMRSNGVPVSVVREPVVGNTGENTVVWVPMGLNANAYNTTFPFGGADTVYSVAISNIVGAPKTWYTYTVTVFDPTVPGADYFPPVISGPGQPVVGANNTYTFSAVPNATSYDWRVAQRASFSLSDGAETGLGNFTVDTSAGYSVRDSSVKAAGAYSFHLAHPVPTSQMLQLNRLLLPSAATQLTFKSRLGWATPQQIARVQVSTNDGALWQDVYAQAGTDNAGETSFTTRSLSLAAFSGRPVRLRFNYHCGPFDSHYPQTSAGVGWYLDDIVLSSSEELVNTVTNSTTTTSFAFAPGQATNYFLQARALIYTEFPLDWGPPRQVTAVAGAPVMVLSRPVLTNNQVWIHFTLQAGAAATFKLLQADQPSGPWTTNAAATLTTLTPGVAYRFTVTPAGSSKFYRVQTP